MADHEQSQDTFIAGVGDEVVLFGSFLVLSFCMVIYFSWRRTGNQGATQVADDRGNIPQQPSAAEERPDATEPAVSGVGSEDSDRQTASFGDADRSQDIPGGTEHVHGHGTGLRSRFHGGQSLDPQASTEGDVNAERGQPQDSRPREGAGVPEDGRGRDVIRVRLLQSHSSFSITVSPGTTLGEIRRTNFQEQLAENRPVRFIYRGSVLEDDSLTLQQLGIEDNGALHVHVGRPRPPGGEQGEGDEEVLDLSKLFVPLFGVILGIVWVTMLMYPYIFTLLTKVLLFLLSLGYVFLVYITTRT